MTTLKGASISQIGHKMAKIFSRTHNLAYVAVGHKSLHRNFLTKTTKIDAKFIDKTNKKCLIKSEDLTSLVLPIVLNMIFIILFKIFFSCIIVL